MHESLIHGILKNEHGSISKEVTLIENGGTKIVPLLNNIHEYSTNSLRIGITGPPGAGKSTITNALIEILLKNKKTVGVIAVDPTSPFSGGSLLGDRIRMNHYAWDDRVFVRSMGSNGELGGLARKSQDVGDVLAASGKDVVLYETVGVGQSEHDIVKAADICIVVLVPESGDEVQMMKAGLIEIADLFVINKSDREGAGRLSSMLKNVLHNFNPKGKIEPPVFNTVGTEGKGIQKLYKGIISHLEAMKELGYLDKRRLEGYHQRVLALVSETLEAAFWTDEKISLLNEVSNTSDIVVAPHAMAQNLMSNKNE